MTTIALPTSGDCLDPDFDEVESMSEVLLRALEQPRSVATYQPECLRAVMRRLAIDVASARLMNSEA